MFYGNAMEDAEVIKLYVERLISRKYIDEAMRLWIKAEQGDSDKEMNIQRAKRQTWWPLGCGEKRMKHLRQL